MAASRNMVEQKLTPEVTEYVCAVHTPFPYLEMVNIHRIYSMLLKSTWNPIQGVVYAVGLTREFERDPDEINRQLSQYNRFDLTQLLDSLYMLDVEVYHLAKKVLTNTDTPGEFKEYYERLLSHKSVTDWYFEPYKEPQDYM
jgi:hypothetical protein